MKYALITGLIVAICELIFKTIYVVKIKKIWENIERLYMLHNCNVKKIVEKTKMQEFYTNDLYRKIEKIKPPISPFDYRTEIYKEHSIK